MITEDFVSRKIAILLKEKGFHEPVRYEYHYYNEFPSFHRHFKDFNGQEYDGLQSEWYSAPTIQMVIKWLRLKHFIYIIPYPHMSQDKIRWIAHIYDISMFLPQLHDFKRIASTKLFNTSQEATENAIIYSLNLLKNENNN